MRLLSRDKVMPTKIASDTLDFILASCQSTDPYEFGAILEARDDVITDIVYLPGTESTEISVRFHMYMMPNAEYAGSVHSHPDGEIRPSDEDLIFFRSGPVNIITGYPYGRTDWKAFDKYGNEIELEVVEYDFGDEDIELY